MGRTKICRDDVLLENLESCWLNECRANPERLTFKAFSDYLQSRGIPVSKDTLKHNQLVCEKMRSLKTGDTSLNKPAPGSPGKSVPELEAQVKKLQDENRKLADFISRTYVQSICRHLVNQELRLNMATGLREENIQSRIITAGTEPFQSPIINELAQLFDLPEETE